jgi:Ran GTPase-activating protein 1
MAHIFSLKGKALKLDTREDMEKHLAGVDPAIIEEIHLEGNTIGVDASKALADWMAKASKLKVSQICCLTA